MWEAVPPPPYGLMDSIVYGVLIVCITVEYLSRTIERLITQYAWGSTRGRTLNPAVVAHQGVQGMGPLGVNKSFFLLDRYYG